MKMIGPHRKVGRKAKDQRDVISARYGVSMRSLWKRPLINEQLDRCKDDEARRILLGVSR